MDEKNRVEIMRAFYEKCTLVFRDSDEDYYISFITRMVLALNNMKKDKVDDYLISKFVVQFKNKKRLILSIGDSVNKYFTELLSYIGHLMTLSPDVDVSELQRIMDGSKFSMLMGQVESIVNLYKLPFTINDASPDISGMNEEIYSLFLEVELIGMTKNLTNLSVMLFEVIDDEYLKTREEITNNYLEQIKVL